jgi:hypothetical protein
MVLTAAHTFRQTLSDRCYIDTRATGNEWGSDRATIAYTSGTLLVACRVEFNKAEEMPGKSKGMVYNAAIYFPVLVEPATDSRIRVTKMAGRTLSTAITFAIVGIEKHPHCVKCLCSEVKGATAQ